MISLKDTLISLKVKSRSVAGDLGITACYAGRDENGAIFDDSVVENYLRFDLINNEIDRRNLANDDSDVMLNAIWQIGVFVPKVSMNPSGELLGLVDSVRGAFNQGLVLNAVQITRSDVSPLMDNDTHFYYAISVYFNVLV